jgi:hypothetical protein
MTDAPTEITLAEYYAGPLPDEDIVFDCAICEQEQTIGRWNRDGRSRHLPPICLHCEMIGGGNLSSFPGHKMDARMARQIKAAAYRLESLAWRSINRGKYARKA